MSVTILYRLSCSACLIWLITTFAGLPIAAPDASKSPTKLVLYSRCKAVRQSPTDSTVEVTTMGNSDHYVRPVSSVKVMGCSGLHSASGFVTGHFGATELHDISPQSLAAVSQQPQTSQMMFIDQETFQLYDLFGVSEIEQQANRLFHSLDQLWK